MLSSTIQGDLPSPQAYPGGYFLASEEQAIVGRNEDSRKLRQWFRQKQQGTPMLLIEGEPGIGKSAFANQLINEQGEHFTFRLYGKFHNSSSKAPYLALKQCVHHWLDQLLVLDDEAYERLKSNLREAVHPHERVLTSVLEELEALFGKRVAAAEEVQTDPLKERLRFTYYFNKFLKAVHESGFRTILFFDDLQWADMATLHLVHDLLNRYGVPGLVMVSTFRPVQEEKSYSLILKIKELSSVTSYSLAPLKQQELNKLIPAEWKLQEEEQKAFGEYLLHESGGRPFDALQILSLIVQENLIEATSGGHYQLRWKQLPRIKHDKSSIPLVMRELEGLSPAGAQLLPLASCLGFYFSCESLQRLSGLAPDVYREGMEELVRRKIVIVQQAACYFVHDHFYTAAQALLAPENKKRLHTEIARHLIEQGALNCQHTSFFECVNHLNMADARGTFFKKEALAIINLSAARLAREKSAFDRSLEYYKKADSLLSSQQQSGAVQLPEVLLHYSWLPQPLPFEQLRVMCKLGVAEGEFLVQNFMVADESLNFIFEYEADRLVRLKAYTIKMKIFIASMNLKESPIRLKDGMDIIEALLKEYNIHLPQQEEDFHEYMEEAYRELLELLPVQDMSQLERMELAEEQEFIDLIHLIVHSLPIIFFVNIKKSKYLGVRSVILCLQKGFTPSTPALLATSIWTMATITKNYELAYALGQLGLKLVEKEPYRAHWHSVYHLATLNFFNWKHHYRITSAKLDEAVKISMEVGDHNYAIFCFTNARIIDICRGVCLSRFIEKNYHSRAELPNVNFISQSHVAFVRIMTGEQAGLVEGRFKFSRLFKQQVNENLNGIYHFCFVQELLYLHAGLYQKALEVANICEEHRELYEAFPIGNEHDFYYCLVLSSLAQEKGGMDFATRELIEKRLRGFKKLASMGAGNYLHKQKIIEAELARFLPNGLEVVSLYEEAIEEALKQEFTQLAALAAERCGDFLKKKKNHRLADTYLNDAYGYYQAWGAQAKLEQLVKKYPETYFRKVPHSFDPEQHLQNEQETLKWELVQSALQLSQELYINDLIKRVLQISLEQTKAVQASFLLKQQFSWQVVARLDAGGFSLLHYNFPTGSMASPQKTIYDCLRLNEICYVPKLSDRHDFADVDYFRQKTVHSFMVIPFERHQETLGLIYLENLAPELVETNNLLPWFELLRTQAGIALSNAQLYENQVKLNQEIRKQEQKRIEAVVETQEKERRRVAAELHDNLGQMLSLTKLNLSCLEDSLEGQFSLYEETSRLLDESCTELRRIAHAMMPPDFSSQSLETTLDKLFRQYLLSAGLKYTFYPHQLPEEIPVAVKFNLYRIAQEIIHNILKHANAVKVIIELSVADNTLHMMIEDDGKGFDVQFRTDGLGLKSLYSRATLLNGRLEIDSVIDKGSAFHVYIPLP